MFKEINEIALVQFFQLPSNYLHEQCFSEFWDALWEAGLTSAAEETCEKSWDDLKRERDWERKYPNSLSYSSS